MINVITKLKNPHNLQKKRKRMKSLIMITINKPPANLRLFPMKTSQRIRAKMKFVLAQKNHYFRNKPKFEKCSSSLTNKVKKQLKSKHSKIVHKDTTIQSGLSPC